MLSLSKKFTLSGMFLPVFFLFFCLSTAGAESVTQKTLSTPVTGTVSCESSCMRNGIVMVKDLGDRVVTVFVKDPSDLECSDYCWQEEEGVSEAEPDPEYQQGCTDACMNACEPINPGDEFGEDDIDDDAYCGCLSGCGCGC